MTARKTVTRLKAEKLVGSGDSRESCCPAEMRYAMHPTPNHSAP
jgi:hypothetical protein